MGYCNASYDQCVSYTRCRWLFRRSRDSKLSPTTTMTTSSIIGALKRLACSNAGALSALITILWLSEGMRSSAVLKNSINSLCWWKKFCSGSTIGLLPNYCMHNADLLLVVHCRWSKSAKMYNQHLELAKANLLYDIFRLESVMFNLHKQNEIM